MALPLLLIAPDPASSTIAQALREGPGLQVVQSQHGRHGTAMLRREEFGLILLDENLAAAEPQATASLYAGAGSAPVLELNFAISGAERVLRQVRAALARRAQDEAKARTAVTAALQNELNAALTGVLLKSQLALHEAGPELAVSLRQLIALAAELRGTMQG